MQITLTGKRVLVTGGSSGIGQGIAIAAGKAGAKVGVGYRSSEDGAKRTKQVIEDAGGEAVLLHADVAKPDAVAEIFTKMDDAFGGVDVLINNAGMDGDKSPLHEIDPDDWTRVVSVNLYGTFYCSREAVTRMRKQGDGVILNITSVHELIPWTGQTAYCASKAAISMMTKSLAQELADSGVRTLCVAPGAIKTDINEDVWSDPDKAADLNTKIPMARIGTIDEVADLVITLISDVGSYVTGTTVFVDGGMTTYPSFSHGG